MTNKWIRRITISDCICPKCKNKFPIPRVIGKEREYGHLKVIDCPFCRQAENHREIRAFDHVPMVQAAF